MGCSLVWRASCRYAKFRRTHVAYTLAVQHAADPDSRSAATWITVLMCVGVPAFGEDRGDTYVVALCEYMGLIAQRTGVSLPDLIAANPQVTNPNLIRPGQILNLPRRD